MLEDPKPDAEDERRRVMNAARDVYFVPSYQGHWTGVILFAASLVGVTMLWSGLPTAMSLVGEGGSQAEGRTTFLTLYVVMAAGPIAGWILWVRRRRWAAMAVTALFATCVAWLSPVIGL